jgi:hypothetical protein
MVSPLEDGAKVEIAQDQAAFDALVQRTKERNFTLEMQGLVGRITVVGMRRPWPWYHSHHSAQGQQSPRSAPDLPAPGAEAPKAIDNAGLRSELGREVSPECSQQFLLTDRKLEGRTKLFDELFPGSEAESVSSYNEQFV